MNLSLFFTILPLILNSVQGAGRTLGGSSKSGKSKKKEDGGMQTLTLSVLNQAFGQPFSPFFVMVHNSKADPLYVRGQSASEALATLAEDGSSNALIDLYLGAEGVLTAEAVGGPTFGGDTMEIEVQVSSDYPLVTIASMAINTNDCFVALNGVHLMPGMVLDTPGLDAGSEENNENCGSVPGPACADGESGNTSDGKGEGYVHVHRGVMGISDLTAQEDWRNPMMRLSVSE